MTRSRRGEVASTCSALRLGWATPSPLGMSWPTTRSPSISVSERSTRWSDWPTRLPTSRRPRCWCDGYARVIRRRRPRRGEDRSHERRRGVRGLLGARWNDADLDGRRHRAGGPDGDESRPAGLPFTRWVRGRRWPPRPCSAGLDPGPAANGAGLLAGMKNPRRTIRTACGKALPTPPPPPISAARLLKARWWTRSRGNETLRGRAIAGMGPLIPAAQAAEVSQAVE